MRSLLLFLISLMTIEVWADGQPPSLDDKCPFGYRNKVEHYSTIINDDLVCPSHDDEGGRKYGVETEGLPPRYEGAPGRLRCTIVSIADDDCATDDDSTTDDKPCFPSDNDGQCPTKLCETPDGVVYDVAEGKSCGDYGLCEGNTICKNAEEKGSDLGGDGGGGGNDGTEQNEDYVRCGLYEHWNGTSCVPHPNDCSNPYNSAGQYICDGEPDTPDGTGGGSTEDPDDTDNTDNTEDPDNTDDPGGEDNTDDNTDNTDDPDNTDNPGGEDNTDDPDSNDNTDGTDTNTPPGGNTDNGGDGGTGGTDQGDGSGTGTGGTDSGTPDGNDNGSTNGAGGGGGDGEGGEGDCDSTEKDYLKCLEAYTKGTPRQRRPNTFDVYTTEEKAVLQQQIDEKRQEYKDALEAAQQHLLDSIGFNGSGSANPFYSNAINVMGVNVDLGTAKWQDLFQFLPHIIIFMASLNAALVVFGGAKQ